MRGRGLGARLAGWGLRLSQGRPASLRRRLSEDMKEAQTFRVVGTACAKALCRRVLGCEKGEKAQVPGAEQVMGRSG